MKKLRGVLKMGGRFGVNLIVVLVPLFILAIGLWFWTATTTSAFADDKSSSGKQDSTSHVGNDHEGDHESDHQGDHDGHHDGQNDGHHGEGQEGEKCTVCHNPHNFHEISIPCSEVDKFLQNHPGDFRGHCNVTPSTSR